MLSDSVYCLQLIRKMLPSNLGVVLSLHVDEEHVTEAQRTRQPQRSVGGDAPLAVDDLIDPTRGYVDCLAIRYCVIPMGSRNSVNRISPG